MAAMIFFIALHDYHHNPFQFSVKQQPEIGG